MKPHRLSRRPNPNIVKNLERLVEDLNIRLSRSPQNFPALSQAKTAIQTLALDDAAGAVSEAEVETQETEDAVGWRSKLFLATENLPLCARPDVIGPVSCAPASLPSHPARSCRFLERQFAHGLPLV